MAKEINTVGAIWRGPSLTCIRRKAPCTYLARLLGHATRMAKALRTGRKEEPAACPAILAAALKDLISTTTNVTLQRYYRETAQRINSV